MGETNVKYTLLKYQDRLEDDYYNNLDIQNESNYTFLKRLNINKKVKKFKYVLYLSFQLLLSAIIIHLYHKKKENINKNIIIIFYSFIMIIAIEIIIVIYDISRISSKRILTKQE